MCTRGRSSLLAAGCCVRLSVLTGAKTSAKAQMLWEAHSRIDQNNVSLRYCFFFFFNTIIAIKTLFIHFKFGRNFTSVLTFNRCATNVMIPNADTSLHFKKRLIPISMLSLHCHRIELRSESKASEFQLAPPTPTHLTQTIRSIFRLLQSLLMS